MPIGISSEAGAADIHKLLVEISAASSVVPPGALVVKLLQDATDPMDYSTYYISSNFD
jgi:hypothetical protein